MVPIAYFALLKNQQTNLLWQAYISELVMSHYSLHIHAEFMIFVIESFTTRNT